MRTDTRTTTDPDEMTTIPATTSIPLREPERRGWRRAVSFLGRADGDPARLLILVLLIVALGLIAPAFFSKAS